jgi:MYXO-CTERM domain-containing protein
MHRWASLVALFLLALASIVTPSIARPSVARANGITAHAHISDLAVRELPPGELRDLLESPDVLQALRSGSVFPDSGYAASHAYGEIAHWEPFTNEYLEWIALNHPPPWDELTDRQRVAFLFGAMSHGMADQVFDSLFMHKTIQYDGTEAELDRYAEMWLVIEHDPQISPLEVFVPAEELPPILLASSGETALPMDFERGMGLVRTGIRAIPLLARTDYEDAWLALPWSATRYYAGTSEPGSLPHIAYVVSRYWQVVWERLHGTDDLSRSVVASWPEEGAVNFETDAGRAECRAMIVFGHAIDSASFTGADGNHFHLRPLAGGPDVAAHARFQWNGIANAVLVIPDEDLAYDTEYTVELTTSITTMDGRPLPAPVTLAFRTRCAPDRLADCPPLPEPIVPATMPPARPDAGRRDTGPPSDAGVDAGSTSSSSGCGCRATPRPRSVGTWLLVGLLGVVVLASRARRER